MLVASGATGPIGAPFLVKVYPVRYIDVLVHILRGAHWAARERAALMFSVGSVKSLDGRKKYAILCPCAVRRQF